MDPIFSGPLKFGVFEFDPVSGDLRKHGLRVRLAPRATALLRLLLETPLRTRTREDLRLHMWPEQNFLDFEHGLNKVVHALREALGDLANNPQFIETVASQGYRFLPDRVSPNVVLIKKNVELNSVAVLPITTIAGDSELRFLSTRIVSRLVDAISAMPGLRILAESTVRSYDGVGSSPQRTGESLGVRAIISGELIRYDEFLHLRMELIDVADGAQLSGAYVETVYSYGQPADAELAEKILCQLRPSLQRSATKLPVREVLEDFRVHLAPPYGRRRGSVA